MTDPSHAPETRLDIGHTTEPCPSSLHPSSPPSPTIEPPPASTIAFANSHAQDRNSTAYGSGTTSGPGHGNKTAPDPSALDQDGTRLDAAHKTSSYTGGTKYGSGTTAGPGAGNKLAALVPDGEGDSRKGKVMEKEGGVLKNEGLVAKGQEKREVARGTEKE